MTMNLHVYNTPFTHESRMLKITAWQAKVRLFDRVEVAATWNDGLARQETIDEFRHVSRFPTTIRRFLPGAIGKVAGFLEWYARLLWHYKGQRIDLINAHSLTALPVCIMLKWLTGAKMVYDTHELETETSEVTPLRRFFGRLVERFGVRRAAAVGAVGDSIGAWYEREYGLSEVHVVKNYPPRRVGSPERNSILRDAFGLTRDDIIVIYHGIISEARGSRVLVEAFAHAPAGWHIVFMGFGSDEDHVKEAASRHANIHFHPAVKPSEVHRYVSGADVGIYVLQNNCLNNYYICPNKVFDNLNAGLALIVSDFPDIAAEVRGANAGWCIEPTAPAIAALMSSIGRADVVAAQKGAEGWADRAGWETQLPRLEGFYRAAGFVPNT